MIEGAYKDPANGVDVAVGVVTDIQLQAVSDPAIGAAYATFRLRLYVSRADYDAGRLPAIVQEHTVDGPALDAAMAGGAELNWALQQGDHTLQEKINALIAGILYPAENYVLRLPEFAGWARVV
jgi:hypothetical protein